MPLPLVPIAIGLGALGAGSLVYGATRKQGDPRAAAERANADQWALYQGLPNRTQQVMQQGAEQAQQQALQLAASTRGGAGNQLAAQRQAQYLGAVGGQQAARTAAILNAEERARLAEQFANRTYSGQLSRIEDQRRARERWIQLGGSLLSLGGQAAMMGVGAPGVGGVGGAGAPAAPIASGGAAYGGYPGSIPGGGVYSNRY